VREFCVRTPGMRWVLVTDEYGTAAAVPDDLNLPAMNSASVYPRVRAGFHDEKRGVRVIPRGVSFE